MVTGYGGFVAGSVAWQAVRSGQWDVHALSLLETPQERDRFHCRQFDLCDAAALEAAFAEVAPAAVIHAAALADIDFCQSNQDAAQRVNVGVTEQLAELCRRSGAKLILCSTDSVFDGTKGMYREEDPPRALNFYAETKLQAERVVRDTVPQGVVTRLGLVMGLPVLGAGNSFVAKMQQSLGRGEQVKFPANEIRTPVDVITLGRALLEIAAGAFTGTIHLAGSTRINRYEMACFLADRLGYRADMVVATDSNALAGRAPRPNDASLDNAKARRVLATPMLTLSDGLDLVLRMKELQKNESSNQA
jgi:dTDP-4-dehydrorhamnose reductase